MNILILGGGGREHALAWAFSQNPKCARLVMAPGNGGMAALGPCVPIDINDGAAVVALARAEEIDLVVIGPEAPLVAGVADAVRAAGIACFGPSAGAAQLEASKQFTKEVCAACNAPTARSAYFEAVEPALAYLEERGAPIVVKADGLAAGKGVTVAEDMDQARGAVRAIFEGQQSEGAAVVIEEKMEGDEASLFVLCDGQTALPFGTAQDHKRAFDGDMGPNTGGMGAYSPAPIADAKLVSRAMDEIVTPTLAEMAARGTPFQGVLYVGLMIQNGAPRLVEYNVRLGDPECQVLMMRLGGQALDLIDACASGRLAGMQVHWADDHALTVVMAAQGYPGAYGTGEVLGGLDLRMPGSVVFHAGTVQNGAEILSAGGRVLNVTARGPSLAAARDLAYGRLEAVAWPGAMYRRDIGWRALT
ncbi:MAG: phosphoribosylamine--glycine ligase [Pseudomonadota bacterium]